MADPELIALLRRLDVALTELGAVRDELRGFLASSAAVGNGLDDLSDANLIDTTSAQERFNYDRHTLARWCRTEGLGVRRGGRWLVSIPRLQRYLNGGG
jgi:hypothetical protein